MSTAPRTSSSRPARPTVTVVVPAKNEAANLRHVLPGLPAAHEVIVVDGHSDDDTVAVVRAVRPRARLIQQTRGGKGNALACGMQAATGDVIVLFDADGSADPVEIDRFVDALAGADVAKGSRELPGGGSIDLTPLRRWGNRALTAVTNRLFRTGYTDLCYGYNALWRDIVPQLDLPAVDRAGDEPVRGDGFEIEAILHCRIAAARLRVTEVPSMELPRLHGTSNLSVIRDGWRVLRTILTEWRLSRGRTTDTPISTPDALPGSLVSPRSGSTSGSGSVPSPVGPAGSDDAPVVALPVQRRPHAPAALRHGDRRAEPEELLDAAG